MTKKNPTKFKAVKAWMLSPKVNGGHYAFWTFDRKADLTDPAIFHRSGVKGRRSIDSGGNFADHWIPVLISPLPPSRKKPRTRK